MSNSRLFSIETSTLGVVALGGLSCRGAPEGGGNGLLCGHTPHFTELAGVGKLRRPISGRVRFEVEFRITILARVPRTSVMVLGQCFWRAWIRWERCYLRVVYWA